MDLCMLYLMNGRKIEILAGNPVTVLNIFNIIFSVNITKKKFSLY